MCSCTHLLFLQLLRIALGLCQNEGSSFIPQRVSRCRWYVPSMLVIDILHKGEQVFNFIVYRFVGKYILSQID